MLSSFLLFILFIFLYLLILLLLQAARYISNVFFFSAWSISLLFYLSLSIFLVFTSRFLPLPLSLSSCAYILSLLPSVFLLQCSKSVTHIYESLSIVAGENFKWLQTCASNYHKHIVSKNQIYRLILVCVRVQLND